MLGELKDFLTRASLGGGFLYRSANLAQVFICLLNHFARPLLHPRMDDRRKWMGLSCLANVGVEAEEPKLEGQRRGGGFVIDVPPSAWAVSCSFTGASRVHRSTPLVCCVPVGVCVEQSPRCVPAIPNLIPLKDQV